MCLQSLVTTILIDLWWNSPVLLDSFALSPIPHMKAFIKFNIPTDWARWGVARGSILKVVTIRKTFCNYVW